MLRSNKAQPKEMTDDESEGLAPLIREIQDTSAIVNYAVAEHLSASGYFLYYISYYILFYIAAYYMLSCIIIN